MPILTLALRLLRGAVLAAGLFALAGPAWAAPKPSILFLNSYHPGYTSSDDEVRGFREGLGARARDFDIRVEYMDAKRHPEQDTWPLIAQLLGHRYKGQAPALLMASDNDAFDFLRAHRARLFPGVPMVFCGINNFEPAWIADQPAIAGVQEYTEYRTTLETAWRFFPARTRILAVTDSTLTGREHVSALKKDLLGLGDRCRLELLDLSAMSMAQMQARLSEAGDDELVLFLAAFKDAGGATYTLEEALEALVPASRAPVFALNEARVLSGVLGGRVISGYGQGATAAGLALRVLDGADPKTLGVATTGSNRYLFDALALDRWGVPRTALPPGSELLNTRPGWWSRHGRVVLTGVLATLLTALVLGTMLFNVERRRQAEQGLIEAENRQLEERARAEAQRAQLELKVQQTQKLESLGVLAGGIAHDFNNLLTSMMGNADLSLEGLPPDSKVRPYVQGIETAARRAAELCRQLLAYSGRGRFQVQPLDLGVLVSEMGGLLSVSISKQVRVEYELAKGLPPIEADATQLRQVVMNLITNASEAIGEAGGVIRVRVCAADCDAAYLADTWAGSAMRPGPCVCLEVADNGCGMDKATLARIFDPFYTTKFTGRGLGLAAVLGIVRGHQAAIKVYSEPGRGSSFKLLFPASRGQAQAPAAAPAPEPAWKGRGTVLLADDEETVRQVGRSMLEHAGLTVLCAADGLEALEVLKAHPETGCVVLDLTMPRLGGEDCFRELQRIKPGIPVVLSSGYNEQEAVSRFQGQHLAGFVGKPYKTAELLARVRAALEEAPGGGSHGA